MVKWELSSLALDIHCITCEFQHDEIVSNSSKTTQDATPFGITPPWSVFSSLHHGVCSLHSTMEHVLFTPVYQACYSPGCDAIQTPFNVSQNKKKQQLSMPPFI
eukprot:TRINITY_DN27963_c1_g1_i2.p1 TRINITY_DN27963_c1_g1~~TRINITY_DN27963_c1_g1_i2.p1  ORF type:complete len:104 (-),score=15.31 TRINITY_DN27963_c1_g1_i2:35-346(-)